MSQLRLLFRLVIVLTVCLIAVALPSAPTQAQCVPYGIELSPESAPPGTEVTVYGHDFAEDKLVDIYYGGTSKDDIVATGRTDKRGDFTLTFTVPEGCTGYYWILARVGSSLGVVKADRQFAVKPGLVVSPEKGPAGTTVAVKGQGFARNEDGIELRYYLTSDSYEMVQRRITANAKGSWQASFQIPLSNRGEHKIDAQGAESKLYQVDDAIFRVTGEINIDKSSGSVGDTITMTGSKFTAYEKGIKILFDGEAVVTGIKANSKGEWEESFQVPEMPAGEYNVTAEGEQTRKEDMGELSFEIEPDIALSSDEGHVGMELTVAGHGFAAGEDVVIKFDSQQVATTETDNKGSFETSFAVPSSQHGERLVTVGYSADDVASAAFTMESDPPPTPQLLSPDKGSRLGFWSQVTPTLEWSQVSDESGIRYNLQVATSADFSTSSIIISATDLTEMSYTPTEALPNRTYYWRVKAVDGAENESNWSAAYSFRVGLLPRWGFIAIIAAAAVLLLLLIRALVIRRTIYYDRW